MIKRLCLVLLAFVSLLIPRSATAQTSSLPYVFYYSEDHRAFVIERADGEDTRLLGEGLFDFSQAIHIEGPGWSPSGKWLAWSAGETWGIQTETHLLKSDDTIGIPLVGYLDPTMVWAPHQDILLVAGASRARVKAEYIGFQIEIVDAESAVRRIIIPQLLAVEGQSRYPVGVRWIDDHRSLVYFSAYEGEVSKTDVLIVNPDGSYTEKIYRDGLATSAFPPAGPVVSATGNIAYRDLTGFTVENIFTDEKTHFDLGRVHVSAILWSPTGEYALVIGETAHILNMARHNLTAVPRLSTSSGKDLGNGDAPLWMPNGRDLILHTPTTIFHLDVETVQVQLSAQNSVGQATGSANPPQYVDASGRLYVITETDGDPDHLALRKFDFQRGERQVIPLPEDLTEGYSFDNFEVSPDGRYAAWMEYGADIVDLSTHSLRRISPSVTAIDSEHGGYVRWSPDSEWLMTFDNISMTGEPAWSLQVVRRDGTARRDLSFTANISPAVFNFLPPRVKLENLPAPVSRPPLVKPFKTLYGQLPITYLSWNPDGTQLIAGNSGDNQEGSRLWTWDIASGKGELSYWTVGAQDHVVWQRLRDGRYIPELHPWKWASTLAVSPGHRYSIDALQVFDIEKQRITRVLDSPVGFYSWAAFSPDGRWLITGGHWLITGNAPAFRIWKTGTWELVREMRYAALAIAFSPDGKYLATGNGWDIDIWKASDLLPQ